ncbi:MAG: T9SS type A sorting domain-containing protein [Bacteroidia bacterium]|nr:T9SS type A sorting domain-containing protein [Bacteroidia bacterium]
MNFRLIFSFFIFSTILNLRTAAQPYFQWYDSIPVKINSSFVANPWAGGLNFTQISSVDMDMDGDKDLFVFDRTGNKARTFINNGAANTVDYKYNPYFETKFPKLHDWALLYDFNCDGKEDIFSYSDVGGGFDVYKNTSTLATGLQFQKIVTQQRSIYNPPSGSLINLYVSSVDIPAISDIDNDGDVDVVTFAITGTYMEYHKNMSIELGFGCDSLKFQVANRCWGYAAENSLSNDYTLYDTCFGNVINPELTGYDGQQRSAERHAGSCELCIDLDNDGDKEFIVGDVSYPSLTMLTNNGTLTDASFSSEDVAFPFSNGGSQEVDMTLFPCAFYQDVNNDGKKDLLVSPSAPNASENANSIWYYQNTGTNSFPVFQFQQTNLLQDKMIELGEGAYPVFFDYDNDGLKDLFIGNYGYYNAAGFEHKIAQFKNIGTTTAPQFELITRDYKNLSTYGITNMVPAFGDMDGDTDADMILGAYDGRIHYFQNIAAIGATANFVLSQANLKNSASRVIDVGDFAAPQIFDVDNDGKNDIVIGARNGKLAYYRRTSTTGSPVVDSVSHFWGNVKVNLPFYTTGYSFPFVFRDSGQTKILAGAERGTLMLYDHIDGNLNGPFTLVDSVFMNINQGTRTAPTGTDINNDGFMDLVVGNYQGGVSFYKGTGSIITVEDMYENITWNFDLYPNPSNSNFTIRLYDFKKDHYQLQLYNVVGQSILTERINSNLSNINTELIPNGIYFCKIIDTSNNTSLVKRVVIQH